MRQRHILSSLLGAVVVLSLATQTHSDGTADAALLRIAFGSCSKHNAAQPLWEPIVAADPDLWIWTGDIVYADTEDMDLMRAIYSLQAARPDYARLVATCPVIGTWDDHDYGVNNGGLEYPQRRRSQQLLLDFLDVDDDDPRRQRAGVYRSHVYGPPGQRVKVILLDTRYHRQEPAADTEILGARQRAWLEAELARSDAQVHLIVSSIQVIAEEHEYEKWANFPRARQQLFALIRRTGAQGVVFISGDRHIAEISRLDTDTAGYPLYDITSSGMTHSWRSFRGEPNRHRLGEVYHDLHFGLIEFDWSVSPPMLEMQIRDQHNEIQLRQRVSLSVLAPH
ncbi:MAG: alkaline phosphatase family protein [Gemmatimonadetes bacterium]|nr:alkaline phosphatase family protein [Gemmatimonadota bacterium]